jgi:hypothetical protein
LLVADLMNRMFKNVGAERITVAEALAHPWLAAAIDGPEGIAAGGPAAGGSAVLIADMERRRAEVKRQKAAEKEKAMREKEEERR